jgi:membrane-bound serine protease (ClpP class)
MLRLLVSASKYLPAFGLVLLLAGLGAVAADERSSINAAQVIQIVGAIGPATADYVSRSLNTSAERGAPVAILTIDTPGGLDASMRDINRAILASSVPVVAYVHPSGARAASAGTYILYASHVAAMTPGTNLGAATPVSIGGGSPFAGGDRDNETDTGDEKKRSKDKEQDSKDPSSDPMKAKAVNDAVAYIRSLAELRGRNADWAEKAVRHAESLSANDAKKNNVVDIVATNINDLLAQTDGRRVAIDAQDVTLNTKGLSVEYIEPDWRTRLLATITNPNVALILMLIGVYGLIFEFMNPGALIPGIIGAICLLLGLYALALLPVNYAGIGLVMLGIGLMVAEAFAPSFGALGVGGAAAFIIGAAIMIDTEAPEYQISLTLIGILAVTSLAAAVVVARLAISSYRRRVATGIEEMTGARGEVTDWRGYSGHVIAHGERWKAISEVPLSRGQPVRVIGVDGLVLRVEPTAIGKS